MKGKPMKPMNDKQKIEVFDENEYVTLTPTDAKQHILDRIDKFRAHVASAPEGVLREIICISMTPMAEVIDTGSAKYQPLEISTYTLVRAGEATAALRERIFQLFSSVTLPPGASSHLD